jgi:hypothetical protein
VGPKIIPMQQWPYHSLASVSVAPRDTFLSPASRSKGDGQIDEFSAETPLPEIHWLVEALEKPWSRSFFHTLHYVRRNNVFCTTSSEWRLHPLWWESSERKHVSLTDNTIYMLCVLNTFVCLQTDHHHHLSYLVLK